MEIVIQHFDGCPSWETARDRIATAATELGIAATITLVGVESAEEAEQIEFRGSPSILVGGRDLFPNRDSPIGLSCRVYPVDGKRVGSPSLGQLVEALRPYRPPSAPKEALTAQPAQTPAS